MMAILMGTLFESYLCGKTICNVGSHKNLFLLWQKAEIQIAKLPKVVNITKKFQFIGRILESYTLFKVFGKIGFPRKKGVSPMQENPDLDVDYDSDLFFDQFLLVKRFVYHLFYYRTLHKELQTHPVHSEFWIHTTDAHLLQATMYWCMVFGSVGQNPTHWKRLSPKNPEKIRESFRTGVTSHTGLTWEEWERYWTKMKNFRDTYAAHRETAPHDPVPNFDMALQVAYYYDDWLRRVLWKGYSLEGKGRIYGSIFDERPLKETWEMLEEQTTPLINSCIKQTKDFTGG